MRVQVGELLAYQKQLLSYVGQYLIRLIGVTVWFVMLLHFMCVHYSEIKGNCGVSSSTPVEVVLCITGYTAQQVVLVHSLDEVRVNGGCLSFYFFPHEQNIH